MASLPLTSVIDGFSVVVTLVDGDHRREDAGGGLGGDDEEVALGDRLHALGADAGGQQLEELRRALADVVDADHVAALATDEQQVLVVELLDGEGFGLDALVGGAGLVEVTGPDRLVLERRAGLEHDGTAGVEHGEAAAAAFLAGLVGVVALVGGDEGLVVDPGDGVGLTATGEHGVVEDDAALALGPEALLDGVDVHEVDRAGGEAGGDLGGAQVDDRQVVVLLQGDDGLVARVDVDVLGLRVGRRVHAGQVGEVDELAGPGGRLALDVEHDDGAGRQLRDERAVDALVALVLDDDGGVAAVGRDVDRVGLTAEVDGAHDGAGAEVDHEQRAGGRDEVAVAGVDRHERVLIGDADARGLAADGDGACGDGRFGSRMSTKPTLPVAESV